jgi:hypothetical protein
MNIAKLEHVLNIRGILTVDLGTSTKTEARRGEARQDSDEAKRGEADFLKMTTRRGEARSNINEAKRGEVMKYCLVSGSDPIMLFSNTLKTVGVGFFVEWTLLYKVLR